MKERSAMSMATRMGTCVRALVISAVLVIGGVLVAGPAAADEDVTVSGCSDTTTYSLEQMDQASGDVSLAEADERAARISIEELGQRAGDTSVSTIDEMSRSDGLMEADAHTTSSDVHCNM